MVLVLYLFIGTRDTDSSGSFSGFNSLVKETKQELVWDLHFAMDLVRNQEQ